MACHHRTRDRESHAGAALVAAGREERVKDLVAVWRELAVVQFAVQPEFVTRDLFCKATSDAVGAG